MQLVRIPKVLIPKDKENFNKWACIACDQFSAQKEYWEELSSFVGDAPSTLNLILPEAYLSDDNSAMTKQINLNMENYLRENIFEEINSFILVKRLLNNGKVRLGLVVEIDLEEYDYTDNNQALIKATEKTVVERLPARIDIRKNASLELPHIMVLLDDKDCNIIEPLYQNSDYMDKIYDFELNMNGGYLTGFKVDNSQEVLDKLNNIATIGEKNGRKIAFVVGDGNHSLATAKECWNIVKTNLTDKEKENHPARYALVELVNIYDESLDFEPIHRLLIGADEQFVSAMQEQFTAGDGRIQLVYGDKLYSIPVSINSSDAIKDIQDFIDNYKLSNTNIIEEYIHGDNNLELLVKKHNAVGIYMPTINKNGLFDYCFRRGTLPRKSFSIGEANDKRYYFEAKKIKL